MTAKTLMVQGTASSVGKSILVTALCRILHQDGYRVAPYKSQNMALNSFVTREGGEIGRAQAAQAEAACIEPSVHMNPILLKPEADAVSQVVVLGKVWARIPAREYYRQTPRLLKIVEDSLARLCDAYDVVIIEGAGSPAEVNFRDTEIVNMRVARLRGTPVLLAGDIDRGGVFASLVGTLELLTSEERALVKGFVINKFRGNLDLLKPGLEFLEKRTGLPVLGVIPWIGEIGVAQEDSVYLDERRPPEKGNALDVAVIGLPHTANYDDFDPLEAAGCALRYVKKPADLGDPDLIVIPGTKATGADLAFLRDRGLDKEIVRKVRDGTPLVGICGGYQMLGRVIRDPQGVESSDVNTPGLGLLDIETVFQPQKRTVQVKARVAGGRGLLEGLRGTEVGGYEIHMGASSQDGSPAFEVFETPQGDTAYHDGCLDSSGMILGTYIHGLFNSPAFTEGFLGRLRKLRGRDAKPGAVVDRKQEGYDRLAAIVREHLDMSKVYGIINGRA